MALIQNKFEADKKAERIKGLYVRWGLKIEDDKLVELEDLADYVPCSLAQLKQLTKPGKIGIYVWLKFQELETYDSMQEAAEGRRASRQAIYDVQRQKMDRFLKEEAQKKAPLKDEGKPVVRNTPPVIVIRPPSILDWIEMQRTREAFNARRPKKRRIPHKFAWKKFTPTPVRCAGCGKPIIWASKPTGNFLDNPRMEICDAIPIDPKPHPEGTLMLSWRQNDLIVTCEEVSGDDRVGLYRSHFETCDTPDIYLWPPAKRKDSATELTPDSVTEDEKSTGEEMDKHSQTDAPKVQTTLLFGVM